MGKQRKAARNLEKAVRKRALSNLVKQRDCVNCGRWQLFSRRIYEATGELCSAESCPNAVDECAEDVLAAKAFDAAVLDFEAMKKDYEDNEALNEKSEDSPASLTTKTST